MILETFLSEKILGFPKEKLYEVKKIIKEYFPFENFTKNEISDIIELLKHDKKNTYGTINFVLLQDIALPKWDIQASTELILQAFEFYKNE